MRNFYYLTKVHFLSFYGINKVLHSKKNKLFSGVFGLILLALLIGGSIAYMGYTYAEMFALSLGAERLTEIFALMIAYASVIGFCLSFYTTGTLLYSFKDYEMTASLPVKTHVFVLSKLFFMYVTDLMFTVLLIVPSAILFVKLPGVLSIDLIIRLLALLFVSPLFTLALSVVVGAVISFVSSRFNKRNLVQTIMLLAFVLLCFGSGFTVGIGQTADISGSIKRIYFILPLLVSAVNGYVDLLWFSILCVLLSVIVITTVCATYKTMNTLMTAKRTKSNYKLKSYNIKSEFSCLLGKEIRRLFSLPIYVLNCLLFSVLGVVVCIVLSFSLTSILPIEISGVIIRFAPALCAFMYMLIPSTACSISVEGSSFWIIKTAPVSAKKLLNIKLFINVLFGAIPAFISFVALSIALIGLPFITLALMALIAVLIALLGGNLGLIYNLLFPVMKWENPSKPIKQSLSVLLCTITAMAMAGLLGVGAFYISLKTEILFAIFAGALLVLNVVSYMFIMKYGEKLLIDRT